MKREPVIRVALAAPLMRLFDYLPPNEPGIPRRGQRVAVPFGPSRRVGVVCHVGDDTEVPAHRLRRAIATLDADPLLDEELMRLLEWASGYYHHPPGEVIATALPAALRRSGAADYLTEAAWRSTVAGRAADPATLSRRARVQGRLLALLNAAPDGLGADDLGGAGSTWRRAVRALEEAGLVERYSRRKPAGCAMPGTAERKAGPAPTGEQRRAIEAIGGATGFEAFLLEGITGSGKTEVYLRCIERCLAAGRQSLVIVPEIGLTPQLVARFGERLDTGIAVMHSGLGDAERLRAWLAARDGAAGVVIGTRSAVFVPLSEPGLIVVDEEHDSSLKQQDGFRYSARDIAVWRARQLGVPVVLGSATPSLETIGNAEEGRYVRLRLPRRPGAAQPPKIRLIDLRHQPARDGLTEPLREAIARHLDAGGQVLVYLNRRGFAPSLLCASCGSLIECRRCDARMVLHRRRERLVCHHCGAERSVPAACEACGGDELVPVGQGTERLEAALERLYPEHRLVRIDRDTTRRRGEVGRRLEQVRTGKARILLGTQMLTKGHDFPDVSLVCIVDADQGLFGTDFRAGERLAQSFVQVAGRAGRGDRPGEVYLQTLFPDHPLLQLLITEGYESYARAALAERKRAAWPPFAHLALLRAESARRPDAFGFLDQAAAEARALLPPGDTGVRILGPAPAPMERRGGRYRGQLLIRGGRRAELHRFLGAWRARLEGLPSARKARWSLDVDPVELF